MSDRIPVSVNIFSDIICPWCFIGKKRLQAAAAMHGGITLDIKWRAFLLNPGMQSDGMSRKAYLEAKFGAAAASFYDRIALVGDEVGIPFAFDKITRTPNSRPAHELILTAGERADALVEEMFEDYFINGKDLGDESYMAGIAQRHDLPYPPGATHAHQLENDLKDAGRIGINGVPYFIFESDWAISGAHPPESFLPLFDAVVNHRLVEAE